MMKRYWLGGVLLAIPLAVWANFLELNGNFTQGGVVIGRTEPGTRLVLDGQALRVSRRGVFIFGFDRDAAGEARLEVSYPNGVKETRILKVNQRNYAIQRIDGLPAEKVTPPSELSERIRQEAAQLAKARERDSDMSYFQKGFRWPTLGHISGVFGSQRILNGEPRQPHNGIDITASEGAPVWAPGDGVVTLVYPDMYFSGTTVIVDHGHGLSSSLLHLKDIFVKVGQRVKQGDIIASVGATGRVTGPHLHWGMNWFKRRIDPALLVPPRQGE
jgi:murein DD-endopeptidase MepM/ murein hydrolase activator NlpD